MQLGSHNRLVEGSSRRGAALPKGCLHTLSLCIYSGVYPLINQSNHLSPFHYIPFLLLLIVQAVYFRVNKTAADRFPRISKNRAVYRYREFVGTVFGWEPGRTGSTGNRSNRTGSHWFCEPWSIYRIRVPVRLIHS
jgi:hypothetical protein